MSPAGSRSSRLKPCARVAVPLADEVVTQRIAAARLRESPYSELRSLTCRFHRGVLSLQGSVPTYYLKQVAQTIVRQVAGVHRVDNQLQVLSSSEHPSSDCPGHHAQ
jgi:osmotically-inducible protein OsmY